MAQQNKNLVTVMLKKVQWEAIVSIIEPECQRQGKDWIQWGNFVKDTIQANSKKVSSSDDLVSITLPEDNWETINFLIKTNCSSRRKEWKIWADGINRLIQQAIKNAKNGHQPEQAQKSEVETGTVPERPTAGIAASPNWQVREAYAKDPQAKPDILEQLIRYDPVREVRKAACQNPNTTTRVLEEFGGFKTSSPITELLAEVNKHGGGELWSSVALNPNAPGKVLERLASLNTPESQLRNIPPQDRESVPFFEERIRWAVAENPKTPANVLKVLSKDQEWRVRIRVAENRSTPMDILKILSQDENENVRKKVTANLSFRQVVMQQDMNEVQRLLDIIFHVNDSNEREQALKTISQLPKRDELIPIVMEFLHKGESAYYIVKVLESIGTPATLGPLLEVFRAAEPSQFIDDGIAIKRAVKKAEGWANAVVSIGNDGSSAVALVKLDPSLEKLKLNCSPDEFERILFLDIDMGQGTNPRIYKALVELATPRAVGFLIDTLDSTIQNSRLEVNELARQSLLSLKESALPRIRKAIEKPFIYSGSPDSRSFVENSYKKFHAQLDWLQTAITKAD